MHARLRSRRFALRTSLRRATAVTAVAAYAAASAMLGGCAVVTVAGAAAGAAITVTGAVVGSTVKVAGKVVEKTIDVVTPGPATPAPAR